MLGDLWSSRGPAAAFAAMAFFWGGFAALVPALKAQADLSDGAFGLAHLIATIGAVGALMAAPWVSRRIGPLALPGTVLATALIMAAQGLAQGPASYTAWLFSGCVAMGLMDVLMNARVSRIEAETGRTLMNLNHAVYSLLYAGVAVAAGLARGAGASPGAIFAALGLGVLALAVLSTRGPERPAVRVEGDGDPAGLSWLMLAPAGAIVCLAFLGEQATEGWSALHLERAQGVGAAASAIGPALLGLTMGIGRLGGQVATQRFSNRAVIRTASSLAAAGALVAAWAPNLTIAYLGFAALGLGLSTIVPTTFAWVGKRLPGHLREAAIARLSMVGYAGFFLGPPLMGFVAEGAGLVASFTLVAALLVAIPAILLPVLQRRQAEPA